MSMRTYAVEQYGIVVNQLLNSVLPNVKQSFEGDDTELTEWLSERLDAEYIPEFTGDAFGISFGRDYEYDIEEESESYCDDSIYVVPLNNWGGLCRAAYKNTQEIETELREKLGKYLLGDFDYLGALRHIVGTEFC